MRYWLFALPLLAIPLVAQAQSSTPAPAVAVAPVDPARLAAARSVMNVLMPLDQRERMMEQMLGSTMGSINNAITNQPALKEAMGNDPELVSAFNGFMAKQQARTTALLKTAMPSMLEAIAKAYARRFTVPQLKEVEAFFSTPTGKTYMAEGMTIMSDPDVTAWMQEVMGQSLGQVEQDLSELVKAAEAKQK
jgi:hypothetical protein